MIQPARFALMVLASSLLPVFSHAEIALSENHRTLTQTCTERQTIAVSGNENTLHLSGPCSAVELSGNRNRVSLAEARQIGTPGNQNVVSWTSGSPQISNTGSVVAPVGRPGTGAPARTCALPI